MSYPPPPAAPYGSGGYAAPIRPKHLRGFRLLILALIFGVLGIALVVVGVVVAATSTLGAVDDLQRVSAASGGTINVDRTGKWVAYYEAEDVSEDLDRLPNVAVAVTGPAGAVTVHSYGNRTDGKVDKFVFSYHGHHGVAIQEFDATRTGTYRIRVITDSSIPANADVAFGKDLVNGTVVVAVALIIPGVLLVIAAIVLLIVGLVRRSRHKGQLSAPGYGAGYPAYPYGAPGPQSGGPPGGFGAGGYGGYGQPPSQPPPSQPPPNQPPPG